MGSRVVISPSLRKKIVQELHETHPGMTRMKALARQYVWWPKLDAELEAKVRSCMMCQLQRNRPESAPVHPWEWPQKPWSRVHADFAGPFLGKMFLVLVDTHSKWMEIHTTMSTSTDVTLQKMRTSFATLGLPEILVTDNGTSFTSTEFQEFVQKNGIRHIRCAPYHPSSNGLAERAVQTFKSGLKKTTKGSLETRLAWFLFTYRLTPHATTGVSPSQLMFGRHVRSHLDLVRPNIEERVRLRQEHQKLSHDQHAKRREFEVGDMVYARNFAPGDKWLPGKVTKVLGPVSYTMRRHVDQLRTKENSSLERNTPAVSPASSEDNPQRDTEFLPFPPPPSSLEERSEHSTELTATSVESLQATLRRSARPHKPPDRLTY